jgi:hypothetical protein
MLMPAVLRQHSRVGHGNQPRRSHRIGEAVDGAKWEDDNSLGLWEAMPVIGKSEDKAARCLKAAMQWCLFWCVELLAGNRILVNVLN